MIELERRLQHAARELREVQIEAPPLSSLSAPRRPSGILGRVPALVMPVLFVLGGLAVVTGGVGRQPEPASEATTAAPAAVEAAAVTAETDESAAVTLTAHQEIALIAALAPAPPPTAEPAAPDARSFSRHYR